jgi:hypothetical protein
MLPGGTVGAKAAASSRVKPGCPSDADGGESASHPQYAPVHHEGAPRGSVGGADEPPERPAPVRRVPVAVVGCVPFAPSNAQVVTWPSPTAAAEPQDPFCCCHGEHPPVVAAEIPDMARPTMLISRRFRQTNGHSL